MTPRPALLLLTFLLTLAACTREKAVTTPTAVTATATPARPSASPSKSPSPSPTQDLEVAIALPATPKPSPSPSLGVLPSAAPVEGTPEVPTHQVTTLGLGYLLLAASGAPGAKVYLTRQARVHFDAEGRLVSADGLLVVGGSGALTDPISPVLDEGDHAIPQDQFTLGLVTKPTDLDPTPFGATVLAPSTASGPITSYVAGDPEVGALEIKD